MIKVSCLETETHLVELALTRAIRPFETISQLNSPEAGVDPHGNISCIPHRPDLHVFLQMITG